MILRIPLFISGAEIIFIVFIIVMVFGADKVPEIARGLGKGMRQIKDATNDIKREITKTAEKEGINIEDLDITKEIPKDLTQDITKEVTKVKDDIENVVGPIKRRF